MSVILPVSKDTILYSSTSWLFQKTYFHFCNGLQHCVKPKWQMVSQWYCCYIPKLTEPGFFLTKMFIFFAHNSYLGLALPYYSHFIPLILTLPEWEAECGCQWAAFMTHIFAPAHRTAGSQSHTVHGKTKILSCSISRAFGKTVLIKIRFLVKMYFPSLGSKNA